MSQAGNDHWDKSESESEWAFFANYVYTQGTVYDIIYRYNTILDVMYKCAVMVDHVKLWEFNSSSWI